MTKKDGITAGSITHELRRGALVLAILSQLSEEHYGYSLRERLAAKGLDINEGWKIEGSRPRRYYSISARGRKVLKEVTKEWKELGDVMKRLLSG